MTLNKITLATSVLLSAFALTACDKKEAAPAKTAASTTTTTTVTSTTTATVVPAVASTPDTTVVASSSTTTTTAATNGVSPTVQLWIDSTKIGTLMMLKQQHPKMTAEQKTCLQSRDADATYLPKAQEEMTRVLSAEDLKNLDTFYTSEVGKKVVAMTHQQFNQMMGEPTGAPIALTPEEQKQVVTFMQNPSSKKIQADTAKMTDKEAETMIKTLADKERARCKIA